MSKLMKRIWSALLAIVMIAGLMPASFAAEPGPQFLNGPYLLAPKTTSMVVVWESTAVVSSTIAYGTSQDALCEPVTVEIDKDAPDFKGQKMNLFHYKLENLAPDTRYYYEVMLASGES